MQVCQKSIAINASEVAVIWVRGVLRQAYSKVTGDANEARQLDSDSKIDFDAVMKAETDPAKKDALKKEKELLFGTIKAWTENITFMYVCLCMCTHTHTHTHHANVCVLWCMCLCVMFATYVRVCNLRLHVSHVSHVWFVCMAGRQSRKRDDITSNTPPL
jgi:hypothetical protein